MEEGGNFADSEWLPIIAIVKIQQFIVQLNTHVNFILCTCFVIRTYILGFYRCTTSSSAELSHFWGIFFYHGRAKQAATSTCSSHVLEKNCATQCKSAFGTAPSTPSSRQTKRCLFLFFLFFEEAQQGTLSYISIRNWGIMIF